MEWIHAVTLLVYIVIIMFVAIAAKRRGERDALQKRLDDLVKKSRLEQDIELATTDQLMSEVARRVPGFILLMPNPSNKKDETHMQIHIKGIGPQDAIECMSMACHIIANQPPTATYQEGVDDE